MPDDPKDQRATVPDAKPQQRAAPPLVLKKSFVNPLLAGGMSPTFIKGARYESAVVTGTVEDATESRSGNLLVSIRLDTGDPEKPGPLRRFLFAAWGSAEIE